MEEEAPLSPATPQSRRATGEPRHHSGANPTDAPPTSPAAAERQPRRRRQPARRGAEGAGGCSTGVGPSGWRSLAAVRVLLLAGLLGTVRADEQLDLFVSGPFGDNMILQSNHFYGQRAFMSGTAEPCAQTLVLTPLLQ